MEAVCSSSLCAHGIEVHIAVSIVDRILHLDVILIACINRSRSDSLGSTSLSVGMGV